MIPYELLITSASRSHLLGPTLKSLFMRLDHLPWRVIIHEDARDPSQWEAIKQVVLDLELSHVTQVMMVQADPPRRLGLAINWMLRNLHQQTKYILYCQDDFVAVRTIPVARALTVMEQHNLHHIRFNKRATMAFKEVWNGKWYKAERDFVLVENDIGAETQTLTVSDHWYFQLGLWRVEEILKAFDFWTENLSRTGRLRLDEPETLINHFFDMVHYKTGDADAAVRAVKQRTYIFGPIGEDRYVRHIGGSREDWAGDHERSGKEDDQATAWREIQSYLGPHPVPEEFRNANPR